MVTTDPLVKEPSWPALKVAALVTLAWTALMVALGVWLVGSAAGEAAKTLQAAADEQVAAIRDRIDADLQTMRAMPVVLAAQVNARNLLLHVARNPGDRVQNDGLNAHYARIARMIDADTIFLTDAAGTLLAAHSRTIDSDRLIGENASDREYFQEARAGEPGEQFAMARLSGKPSVFFSAPVLENGVFLGAVVVKSTTDRQRRLMTAAGQPHVVLVDENRVVIATTDDGDFLRRLGTRDAAADNPDRRYGETQPDDNPLARSASRTVGGIALHNMGDDGLEVVTSRAPLARPNWSVELMLDAQAIRQAAQQRRLGLLLIWLAGVLLIALVIRSIRHVQDLDDLAKIDVLSGLGNRRSYEEAIESLCDAHNRGRIQNVSLALFDLDRFKQVNDLHGHAAGDRVIQAFAKRLSDSTRRMDQLFRLGGDEFAALVLELTPDKAEQAIQGIVARLMTATSGSLDGVEMPSVSAGLAVHARNETPDTLYKRADTALYRAKDAGRNRLVVADPPEA